MSDLRVDMGRRKRRMAAVVVDLGNCRLRMKMV
jgi:hypothetical protein